ncbi:sensor histidine kinase [Polaribacter porphyrae]|uniref:histidine kinase n=1 Tax=Polaribacter porphyrae TaxID=1137780 RepID=A0A2S7WT17_9FLAO|nr:sensor histidine kinase [Polaribacter porphyrae]PQJ80739.1 hypothetical protein BTO18_16865 [Polaribacter porphyrae]
MYKSITFLVHNFNTATYIQLPESVVTLKNNTDLPSLILGVFFGLMIVMAIYNLLIYFSLRDKAYLLYVATTLFSILTAVSTNKLGDQFLWPNYKGLDSWIYITFAGISMFFSSRFASVFLKLNENYKRLDKFMWVIAGLSILLSFLSIFLTLEQVTPFGRWLVLLSFPSYIGVAIYVYSKGFKFAKYYIIAWIPYVLGLVLMTMLGAGWLPINPFIYYSMEIGGALEIMLLSFALAYRIKGMRIEIAEKELEKQQFKTKLLEEQKIILEQKVEERTAELSEANATKDKFFSIIAHDLRSPMIGLQGVGKKLDYFIKKDKREKLLEMGSQIDKSIDQLNHLLNNLLNWASSQTNRIPYNPKNIDVTQLVIENIALYKSLADAKNVEIKNKITSGKLFADSNAVSTILRNLLSNAIKFTKENSCIKVTSEETTTSFSISVSDQGDGIPLNKIERFFEKTNFKSTSGTSGEKGFGLGLQLCKEFTEMNLGTITVQSELEKGTVFTINFPKNNK